MSDTPALLARAKETLGAVIRGKPEALERLLVGVLGGGHVLLEDVPGVGKTTLAKALAMTFAIDFCRVQFTPDLLPSDIVGAQILDPKSGSFSFRRGPVFTNVLLADEINRASPRTQSALLEAMSEGQVTIDGTTHALPRPFFVLATQNPVDYQGTYPLPEAQLDRFMLRFGIGYPPAADELEVLYALQRKHPLEGTKSVAGLERLLALQEEVRAVEVARGVAAYMLKIVHATRAHPDIELGVSTRGALSLFRAAQARALLSGRSYVSPEDVQRLSGPALAHRVALTQKARYGGVTTEAIVRRIVEGVEVPT